jgi:hypothetical protein
MEILAFVSPLIMITSNSWSNGEVYHDSIRRRDKMHGRCTTHRGLAVHSAVGTDRTRNCTPIFS